MTQDSTPHDAVVTREHRTAVIVAENGHGLASPIQFDWIQNGGDEVLDRYAQALANAEARGRASRDAEAERLRAELAEAAYHAVMKDLLGRAGIENAFNEIEPDIRAEIDATCIKKAANAITAALAARGGR